MDDLLLGRGVEEQFCVLEGGGGAGGEDCAEVLWGGGAVVEGVFYYALEVELVVGESLVAVDY